MQDSIINREFSFFSHTKCEHFPCHEGMLEEDFNCLFCYCPLYTLGSQCGGQFMYNKKGIKDCSNCLLPHRRASYDYIVSRFQDLHRLIQDDNVTHKKG